MAKTSRFDKDNLHHAYLLEGERAEILSHVRNFIENELKVSTVGNPHFWQGEFDSFGIDDGRVLKEMQMNKVAEGDRKIFIVILNSITREAQNSLLKIFEEPTAQTHFFIIAPSAESFLPTLKSRLEILTFRDAEGKSSGLPLAEARAFLKSTKPERLKIAKKMADAVSDEEATKADIIAFVGALESSFRDTKRMASLSPADISIFEQLLRSRDYLQDRSSSVKLVLENLALVF